MSYIPHNWKEKWIRNRAWLSGQYNFAHAIKTNRYGAVISMLANYPIDILSILVDDAQRVQFLQCQTKNNMLHINK